MEDDKGRKPLTEFFENLASFDTETSGTNAKVDRIWQAGFTGKGIDTEEVVNPFYRFNEGTKTYEPEKLSIVEFHERVINMNGEFSKKAFEAGDFTELLYQHHVPPTVSQTPDTQGMKHLSYDLSEIIDKTLGRLQTSDILVLQNHNFENKLLQQGLNDGILNTDTYKRLQEKMENITIDPSTNNATGLLQTPVEVDKQSRRASYIYQTQIQGRNDVQRSTFRSYTNSLNNMMDRYKEAIASPNRKALVVEQMDITRALYANAIKSGYMDQVHANIGLSMNFLTTNLLDRAEKHTALSDSKDTVEVFKKTWSMTEELRTNTVSDETRKILLQLNEAQYKEVHNQFMSTVDSVTKDFKIRGYTNYNVGSNIALPTKNVYTASTNSVNLLKGINTYGNWKDRPVIADFDTAMNNILTRYSQYGNQSIREDYVNKLRSTYREKGVHEASILSDNMKSNFKLDDLPLVKGASNISNSWWSGKTEFLGREMTRGTKAGLIGGGLALLGYMALKDSPKKHDENSYVAQQFYDDQYLGTEFVNFNNRNKHYMY